MIPECLPRHLQHDHGPDHHSGLLGHVRCHRRRRPGQDRPSYGYYRYQTNIMIVCVILLVLLVQIFRLLAPSGPPEAIKAAEK